MALTEALACHSCSSVVPAVRRIHHGEMEPIVKKAKKIDFDKANRLSHNNNKGQKGRLYLGAACPPNSCPEVLVALPTGRPRQAERRG